MISRLAIDIALLPPDKIMDAVIAVNNHSKPIYTLNKVSRMPHITVSQAVITKSNLNEAEARLKSLASEFQPIIVSAKLVNKQSFFYFEIANNRELKKLHTRVMKDFEKLVTYNAQAEDFYDKTVRAYSIDWVRNFRNDAAFENY